MSRQSKLPDILAMSGDVQRRVCVRRVYAWLHVHVLHLIDGVDAVAPKQAHVLVLHGVRVLFEPHARILDILKEFDFTAIEDSGSLGGSNYVHYFCLHTSDCPGLLETSNRVYVVSLAVCAMTPLTNAI